jgi:hypothetical protein
MQKTKDSDRDIEPKLVAFRHFIYAEVDCCIEFSRLTTIDRQKVVSVLSHRAQRHADHAHDSFGWDPQAKNDLRNCHVQLREISEGMADAWRRWAAALLKAHPSQFDCSAAILGLLKQFNYCLGLVEGGGW